jgi:hypothetical protein
MVDTTSLAESAQALFCALVEYANIKSPSSLSKIFDKDNSKDYFEFEKNWVEKFKKKEESIENIYWKFTRTATGGNNLSYSDIKDFLVIQKDWYKSSILIARKFIDDVAKVPGLQKFSSKPSISDIWFYRGDSEVMTTISELFKIANVNSNNRFGDLNKWSPADIYFAEKTAKDELKKCLLYYDNPKNKGQYGFDILNNMISTLMDKGQLLPISLKKTTSSVIIKPVNFDKVNEELEILTYNYKGLRQPWKKSTPQKAETRDIQLRFTNNPKEYIQIRHDASNGEKSEGFKCEHLGGGEAKGGGVSSVRVFSIIFSRVDKSAAANFNKIWREGSDEYKKIMKPKRAKLEQDLKNSKNSEVKKQIKKAYDDDRGLQSALCVTNPAFTFLLDWLDKNDKPIKNDPLIVPPSDRLLQELFRYVTSRSDVSSKFIIMK